MFLDAASFSQSLNAWEEKINRGIKRSRWDNASNMFTNSGLASKLPSWCASEPDCRERQTGGYRIQGDPLVATSGGVSLEPIPWIIRMVYPGLHSSRRSGGGVAFYFESQ